MRRTQSRKGMREKDKISGNGKVSSSSNTDQNTSLRTNMDEGTTLESVGNGASEANGKSTTSVLEFKDASKVFPDGTHALEKVNFSLSAAEFISVVGPSGCGKSTLLRIASGLDHQTSGTVKVTRDNLGYIFQDSTLMPWRTVKANVELLGELYKIPKAERRKKAKEALDLVGLTAFVGHYPNALSGGMKMRVSIARTLTLQPSVFLFDEPFGALDQITRERLNEETIRLFIHEGFAGLFITHSVYEAVYLSSRVLVMSERPGRIVADIEIPFSYPRDYELRFTSEFAEKTSQVSEALKNSSRGYLSENSL